MSNATEKNTIKVLHVIGAMDRAGAETMIMNYYRAIDRNEIQFDFLVHTDRHCDYDDEIEALGGKIYRLPCFTGLNYLQYKTACRRFFAEHPEIDIVHGHIGSCASVYLPEAKRNGKITICHSHRSKGSLSPAEMAFRLATFQNKRSADYYMACSEQAGRDRFGSNMVEQDNFFILKNAIDLERFDSTEEQRLAAKKLLGISEKPVFGHVGRFTEAKNHPFLIETFRKITETLPDAQLLLVGRGENEGEIRKLVEEEGLGSSIHFLGIREDVSTVMAAMDVFLFPSLWEGLGIVAIEAQASGLPCVVSDGVPSEAAILPSTKRLSLTSATEWAQEALACLDADRPKSEEIRASLTAHGYEINFAAAKLTQTYRNLKCQI